MKEISAAFVKAQKQFSPALKTNTNQHFKSKYADLGACVEAVIDALNNNGIALVQHTHDDDTGVTVETVFLHESGETMSSGKLHVPAQKQDPQGYGSALTYARRYSLMAACGIAPEDDDGNAAQKKPPQPQQKQPTPTEEAWSRIPAEDQDFIRKGIADTKALLDEERNEEAVTFYKTLHLDADQTVAFWTGFNSKERSTMKRINEEMKAKNEQ